MTQNTSNFLKVKEFNEVFGHPAPSSAQKTIFESHPTVVKLRNNLINEEFSELLESFEDKDLVEIVDALSDILYVAYGLLVVYGVDGDHQFKLNLQSKIDVKNYAGDEKISLNPKATTNFQLTRDFCSIFFGDLILGAENCKPCTFFSDEDSRRLTVFNTFLLDFENELNHLAEATETGDFERVITITSNITYITYVLGLIFGVDLDVGVDLVHKSNMSKLCVSEAEAKETVAWYEAHEKRYDTPNYRRNSKGYVIFNESTGKILKNINYKPVDLLSLV